MSVAMSALAALVFGTGTARAEVAPRVGLVVATRVNLTEAEADLVSSRLADTLSEQLTVDVIAGSEARRRLPPSGIPDDCVAEPACLRDVSTRLGSDELLFLFLARIGPRLQVDATWVDPGAGAVASRTALVVEASQVTGESAETAARAFERAPRLLLPHGAPRTARSAPAAAGVSAAPAGRTAMAAPDMPDPLIVSQERRDTGRRFTVPVMVAGGLSAAALATGVGFAVAARRDYNELEEDGCARRNCPGANGRVERMERRALIADGLFVGAGVAAVTGIILFFTSGDSEPRLSASAGDGSAIVSFGGTF
jgi:hypothetical protein